MSPKRRGVESAESSDTGVEQANEGAAASDSNDDVERGPTSPDSGSIETIADERSNIERA